MKTLILREMHFDGVPAPVLTMDSFLVTSLPRFPAAHLAEALAWQEALSGHS